MSSNAIRYAPIRNAARIERKMILVEEKKGNKTTEGLFAISLSSSSLTSSLTSSLKFTPGLGVQLILQRNEALSPAGKVLARERLPAHWASALGLFRGVSSGLFCDREILHDAFVAEEMSYK